MTLKKLVTMKKPRHSVTISKGFYLGTTEVTQAQWEAVMGDDPYNLGGFYFWNVFDKKSP